MSTGVIFNGRENSSPEAMPPRRALPVLAASLAAALSGCVAGTSLPPIHLPADSGHPCLACTPAELARLRAAWEGTGPRHAVVAAVVARAEKALGQPPVFPPRGGQHNQWYQCEECQVGLRTVDETHHRCPKCGRVYSGEPYDDVVFSRRHEAILDGMLDCAWAGAVTGERRYSEGAAAVLLGYARRYSGYPYHTNNWRNPGGRSGGHLFEQTLNEAVCLATRIGPAFDLVQGAGALSGPDRREVCEGLVRPMVENIARNRAGRGNWQTWHNAAMAWGGALLGDASWIARAAADPENGFEFQMQASVSADGMWHENSWGYHFYALRALVATAEPARRLGLDLWRRPELRRMFELPARCAMPDGSLPRFGDDVGTSATDHPQLLEPAWNATRDPVIAGLLPGKPNWPAVMFGREPSGARRPPPEGSEAFRATGLAVLRTKGEAGLAAAITFGPYGGGHGHLDKLSFVLFGLGRELGVDPGRAASIAYRLPVHANWYKATVGHNAVVVDGKSQRPAEGRLELFAANDSCAAAAASCDAAYPGVRHRRLLCLMPEYLLVVDELTSDEVRRFDWIYHNRGTAARCPAADREGSLAGKLSGQEYLRDLREGATDVTVRAEFAGDGPGTWLTVAAAAGTEVRTGSGVGSSIDDRVPLVLVTRSGRSARFAAAIEPVRSGGKARVGDVRVEEEAEGLTVRVLLGGSEDAFRLGRGGGLRVTGGGRAVLDTAVQRDGAGNPPGHP